MKEYIPAVQLQDYIHRYWIFNSKDAMAAEKCVMDGKPHPIEAAYVGRAWKNLK
jgi:hypothetical protein